MTYLKPYIFRAYLDWINKSNKTPHILVNANIKGVIVPTKYIDEFGNIQFNIASECTHNYQDDGLFICFTTDFQGVAFDVKLPYQSITGIYTKEDLELIELDKYRNNEPEVREKVQLKLASTSPRTKKRSRAKLSLV